MTSLAPQRRIDRLPHRRAARTATTATTAGRATHARRSQPHRRLMQLDPRHPLASLDLPRIATAPHDHPDHHQVRRHRRRRRHRSPPPVTRARRRQRRQREPLVASIHISGHASIKRHPDPFPPLPPASTRSPPAASPRPRASRPVAGQLPIASNVFMTVYPARAGRGSHDAEPPASTAGRRSGPALTDVAAPAPPRPGTAGHTADPRIDHAAEVTHDRLDRLVARVQDCTDAHGVPSVAAREPATGADLRRIGQHRIGSTRPVDISGDVGRRQSPSRRSPGDVAGGARRGLVTRPCGRRAQFALTNAARGFWLRTRDLDRSKEPAPRAGVDQRSVRYVRRRRRAARCARRSRCGAADDHPRRAGPYRLPRSVGGPQGSRLSVRRCQLLRKRPSRRPTDHC